MRIVLFTPSLVRSSIGQGASGACRAMIANGDTVDVVATEAPRFFQEERHDFGCSIHDWTDEALVSRLIAEADACLLHIGNNYEFHMGGLRWIDPAKGLVCLHDFFLGHLFHGWADTDRPAADAILRRWYGDDVAERYFRHDNSEDFIEDTRHAAPMTEWICSRASAVVTHSAWGIDRVLNACPGPVAVIPLVFDLPADFGQLSLPDRQADEPLNLLTVGHMNPNKRLESVIRAIGGDAHLRDRIQYRLVGPIEAHVRDDLQNLAQEQGVRLDVIGAVDMARLVEEMSRAHVVSCLRHPTLEAASGSAIEAMMSGRPIIVTDTGFYAEIPDAYALKVKADSEIDDLQNVLRELTAGPDRALQRAKAARDWSRTTFSAANYATQCHVVLAEMLKAKPMLSAMERYHMHMRYWSQGHMADVPVKLDPFKILAAETRSSVV